MSGSIFLVHFLCDGSHTRCFCDQMEKRALAHTTTASVKIVSTTTQVENKIYSSSVSFVLLYSHYSYFTVQPSLNPVAPYTRSLFVLLAAYVYKC